MAEWHMLVVALCVPLAWLLGTFPSAQLVARAHGRDVLKEGSGNPGASNVARLLGWRAAAIVLLLDFAKGALAAGAGMVIGGRPGACRARRRGRRRPHVPDLPQGRQRHRDGGRRARRAVPVHRARPRGRVVRGRAAAAQGVARVVALRRCCSPSRWSRSRYDTWEIVVVVALALLVISAAPR